MGQNMRLGIDAVGAAGGIVEAAVCYTGDISDDSRCSTRLVAEYSDRLQVQSGDCIE